ncbi:Rhodanese-like protein [Trametes coccinea BRFM310]|uniref:Rhodanese-like protein n=1 Tax=Trametes coccinea (strain BRFM310) TaxID=1353009 RepID=A0A1Y2J213_TRAC3|nr:Rhodanese-like protein [Trametes coccinea BRFM310]
MLAAPLHTLRSQLFSLTRAAADPLYRSSSFAFKASQQARPPYLEPSRRSLSSSTHSSSPTMLKYITADELAAIIKSDKVPGKDYCVIDVRDDDWVGGNIKGAQNAPSSQFYVHVHDLVQKTKSVPTVVFHCALSQVRGPKAARIYAEARDQLEGDGQDIPHQVFILQGGFSDFQAKYKDDPELVENWSKEVWGHPEWL